MSEKRMRTFLEIIYNCPFILLVIFTGIIFSLFFDETGKRKNEQEAALSQLVVERERADDLPGKDEIELENICNKHGEREKKPWIRHGRKRKPFKMQECARKKMIK